MDDKIKEIISNVLGIDKADVNAESSSETLYNWDSLNHMNLIVALEEEFDIEFDAGDISELMSFTSIKEAISKIQS